jgi:hypothetical protein
LLLAEVIQPPRLNQPLQARLGSLHIQPGLAVSIGAVFPIHVIGNAVCGDASLRKWIQPKTRVPQEYLVAQNMAQHLLVLGDLSQRRWLD